MLFTPTELTSYLPDAAENPARAELLTDLAIGLIYSLVPAEAADTSIIAKSIGLEVTARAYRNVSGYVSETVDDYSYRRPDVAQLSGVYLTDDERASLVGLVTGVKPARVRSVRMSSWSVPRT